MEDKIRQLYLNRVKNFFVHTMFNHALTTLGRVHLGSIRNNNNHDDWNNASKCLFGSYSHSGIPGFSFRRGSDLVLRYF